MFEIINVIVRGEAFITRYETQRIPLRFGDSCLVESDIGIQMAKIVSEPRYVKKKFLEGNNKLRKILRKASDEDINKLTTLDSLEKRAFDYCLECVIKRQLSMKLIRVNFAFDMSKALFMFTSEGRVDFRDLVRDLAHEFKTRIEMKQIGVRDEARLLGGIGNCGQPLCCLTFLRDFHPVSIKMAKDQGLSLIPSKISGLCGRLMCCLQYEHKHYSDLIRKMPKIGKKVMTPGGEGKIKQITILKSIVSVELTNGEIKEYHVDELDDLSESASTTES